MGLFNLENSLPVSEWLLKESGQSPTYKDNNKIRRDPTTFKRQFSFNKNIPGLVQHILLT